MEPRWRTGSEPSLAELFFEVAQLLQGMLTPALLLGRRARWSGGDWGSWARSFDRETDPADVKVLLEAVQLEQIGEFEGADVATGVADFLLEIAHHLDQVGEREASPEELEPEPFPVKTQREVLTGETAIGLVKLRQQKRHLLGVWGHRGASCQ